ncbi:hypothetical protein OKW98_16420 [Pseudomonas sp. KU26590]|uniref:hypothetical protein n=1 Tax=Pseudomonas sp. KU26590 TaxID=2991051 RepID=UPI00223E41B4|nr:hypothetical protein [Pseudomonas sp. KU26590]UZJ58188.1 hypothetical protein OKW98_16420 [Pseudomonas sp. KU26590]
MVINLSPQRLDATLEVFRSGSVLIINGEAFDFTPMADGDTLPAEAISCDWIIGDVHNVDGELELTLLLPLPENYSQAQAFPLPLLDVPDGPVKLPEPLPQRREEFAAPDLQRGEA